MNNFDRIAYWKKRITDHINNIFRDTEDAIKRIKGDAEGIGVDPDEIKNAVTKIGEGYDMLKFSIDKIKSKEESHE